jgi:hypothetical protein
MKDQRKPIEIAQEIRDAATRLRWTYSVRGSIFTVERRFQAGSMEGFRECDMMYFEILGRLPRTEAGSDWGTDGSGIGGMSALASGVFRMNRSGGSKRVLAALAKL